MDGTTMFVLMQGIPDTLTHVELPPHVSLEGTLPRRGMIGLRCTQGEGAVVSEVVAGSPAERASIVAGDIVTAVDGMPVSSPAGLTRTLAGVPVALTVAHREVTVVPTARPWEQHAGAQTVYGEVIDGVRLRSITVRPMGEGRFPCVVYLQGYDCMSIDRGTAIDGLTGFVRALLTAGVGVFRVEKEAVGDSEGDSPEDVSFDAESAHFRASLRAAIALPWVDASRVYVFGHSLGGLHAPVVATGMGVRGVMVYGAGARTWSEYLDANLRHQLALAGTAPDAIEQAVRAQQTVTAAVLVQGASLAEVLARHPEVTRCRELGITSPTRMSGRHPAYWQAVQRASALLPLRALDAPLLAAWGDADWLSSRTEHEELAAAMNWHHPGRGRFEVVTGADHWFLAHPTEAASFAARGRGSYCPAVSDTLLRWRGLL